MTGEFRHCDEVADDPSAPEPLRRFLAYARLPASCKLPGIGREKLAEYVKWIAEDERPFVWTDPEPELYADLAVETTVRIPPPDWMKGAKERVIMLEKGRRVRVVMASRLGDVGITDNLNSSNGYLLRIPLSGLGNFSDKPTRNAEGKEG